MPATMSKDVAKPAPLAERLLAPRSVALIIGLWLAAHALTRLLTGTTLGMDDAEQALSAQAWSWGYRTEQPPLFTWLLLLLQPIFGVGGLPITILRYVFLGLFCWAYWHAARAWLGDDMRAGLATYALPAFYTFGWYAQVDLTHSTVLAAAMAIMLWLAARLMRGGSWTDYVLLGVTLGLGMLGKWNLVMAGAALLITGLILPELRRAVLHPGVLVAAVIAAVIVAPNAYWVLAHRSFAEAGEAVLIRQPMSRLASLWDYVLALVAFPQPWLVLVLILFGPALWRALRQGSTSPAFRVLGTYMLVAIVLHALLIIPFGGVNFSERWIIAILLPLPIVRAALLDPRNLPIDRWLALVLFLVVAALGVRIGMVVLGGDRCPGKCRALAPFTELARDLRGIGFQGGTIVTDDLHLGGNMRVQFQDSRIVELTAPAEVFGPPRGEGSCLLLWDGQRGFAVPGRILDGAASALGIDPEAPHRDGQVSALFPGAVHKRQFLGYRLFTDGPNGQCR